MRDDSSAPETTDVLIGQLLKEYEAADAPDRAAVLRRYGELHPHLTEEFGRVIAAGRLLDEATTRAEPEPPLPRRLGDFRILRRIAIGGMGEIYEAVQEPLGRRVAVKVMRGDHRLLSPSRQARFLREQQVLAELHHTHIVPIHAAGREGTLQYFAMPFIDGLGLHTVLQAVRHRVLSEPGLGSSISPLAEFAGPASTVPDSGPDGARREESPPPGSDGRSNPAGHRVGRAARLSLSKRYLRSVAQVMADAADAVQHAHEARIIHRDLKPSNLMVDRLGQCWVLDFGLAGHLDGHDGPQPRPDGPGPAPELTAFGSLIGTPSYMAPEQYQGRADERSDVWGLGVVLYELLTLRRAFENRGQIESDDPPAPRTLVQNLPRDLAAICEKAIRKDPGDRYPSAREFGDDLRRWLRHEPIRARPARALRRLGLWARRHKGGAAAIAIAASAILMIGAGGWIAGRRIAAEAIAREQTQRRESLIQQLQRRRLSLHRDGWSTQLWDLINQAKTIPGDDSTLRNEAAATLIGLDARAPVQFKDFGASSVAFDPEGRRLLMGGVVDPEGGFQGAKLWDDATRRLLDLGDAAKGPVGFRADGTPIQLVVRDEAEPEAMTLVDLTKKRVVTRFSIPGHLVAGDEDTQDVWMKPDGTLVAAPVRAPDGMVALVVWDGASGEILHRFAMHPGAVAFSPDGGLMAAGDDAGRIVVWSVRTGAELASLQHGRTKIESLAFGTDWHHSSADGPEPPGTGWLLAAGAVGGALTVWDVGAKRPRSFCHGSMYDVYAVAFSPDGATLASCGRIRARLWDVATGRLLLELVGGNFEVGLAFSPNGRRLAVGCVPGFDDGAVRVWDLEDGRGIRSFGGLSGQVARVVFSPDGRLVAALSHDWQVGIWDANTARLRHVLEVPQGLVADNAGLALSPNGRRFAFSSGTEAKWWDLDTGRALGSWPLPPGLCDALAFHLTSQLLLFRVETRAGQQPPYGNVDYREHPRVCRVRDLLGPDPLAPLVEVADYNRGVHVLVASTDGSFFVVEGLGGPGGDLRSTTVYEGQTGRPLTVIPSTRDLHGCSCLSIDPRGILLSVATTPDSTKRMLFEIPSGQRLREIEWDQIGLGPGGTLWATDGPNKLSEACAGYSIYRGDRDRLVVLGSDFPTDDRQPRFSPDGRCFAWGTADGTVFVCDLQEVQRRLGTIGLGW
jgi:serine/threonine protein kinase/WD40 repeat protein